MNELTILNIKVRQDAEGRYCLNDCHRASGVENSKRPSLWLENKQTQELIEEMAGKSQSRNSCFDGKQPVSRIRGGNNSGVWACKELVYAYAMWISPAFHLQVIRAFDALVAGKITPPQYAIPKTYAAALLEAARLAEENEQHKVEIALQKAMIDEAAPKVVALGILAAAESDKGVRDAGRELEVGQQWVSAFVLEHKWACKEGRKLKAAHYGRVNGYVRMCPSTYTDKVTGETRVRDDFKITRKGIDRIAHHIAKRKLMNERRNEERSLMEAN
ncbi:KilA-N domain-containing protein [Swingsia samuiensis]|uniref:KilA-N domain-containing protein n=1 Tax=Swingsia samuiensis TaxID=1293412 RepID=UPI0015E8D980|nr:KilA-N domain-containing protein [Swingsia samuiensis]